MNEGFDKLQNVIALMQLEKSKIGTNHVWDKIVIYNEDFPVIDYGRGLLRVRIGLYPERNFWKVTFHVGNIDDGGWLAVESHSGSQDDRLKKAELIAETVLKDMVKIPDEKTLNELLRTFGMYGTAY